MLTAASLALRDSGDVEGSAVRAATCLKHAEAMVIDEQELVQKAQRVLSEVYLYRRCIVFLQQHAWRLWEIKPFTAKQQALQMRASLCTTIGLKGGIYYVHYAPAGSFQAKERVAMAQSLIRRIKETSNPEAAVSSSEGFNDGEWYYLE